MNRVFYLGFFVFVASTIAFIIAALFPFWILKSNPDIRGIFEICSYPVGTTEARTCAYTLFASDYPVIQQYRSDYSIAVASLSIIAGGLAILFIWIGAAHMCTESKVVKLRLTEFTIFGTLLIDAITIVVWVVMLAKNLDNNNVITVNQIGWSLWTAVGSTGGFLLALVLFCIHRIDLGSSYTKRSTYNESRD